MKWLNVLQEFKGFYKLKIIKNLHSYIFCNEIFAYYVIMQSRDCRRVYKIAKDASLKDTYKEDA